MKVLNQGAPFGNRFICRNDWGPQLDMLCAYRQNSVIQMSLRKTGRQIPGSGSQTYSNSITRELVRKSKSQALPRPHETPRVRGGGRADAAAVFQSTADAADVPDGV